MKNDDVLANLICAENKKKCVNGASIYGKNAKNQKNVWNMFLCACFESARNAPKVLILFQISQTLSIKEPFYL